MKTKIIFTTLFLLIPMLVFGLTTKILSTETRIKIFAEQLRVFKKDVGRYPSSQEGLNALLVAPITAQGWKGPYLPYPFIPKDSWGQPYQYVFPSQNKEKEFDLYSFGENMKNEYGKGDDISY